MTASRYINLLINIADSVKLDGIMVDGTEIKAVEGDALTTLFVIETIVDSDGNKQTFLNICS